MAYRRYGRAHGVVGIIRNFPDELGSLSDVVKGLAIVLDNAWFLLQDRGSELLVHHWTEKNLPCHLCLQLEENSEVARFSRGD